MMVSNREGTSLNRVNVKSWEANPYGKAKLCPYWPAGCAGLLPLPCIDVWHLAQQELKNFPKPKKNVYIYIYSDQFTHFLWVFWGWRWNFQPKTLELQERHPRNMMDKFSLIGLGCFKIFKGSTLWMRSRGLTLRTAVRMSCQQYHIKKWWFWLFSCWVQISGAYLLHPNIISTSTRFIPTKKDLEKRVKKSPARNLKGNKSTTNSITIFFQFDSQPLLTLQPKPLPLGGKLGGKMPSTSPFAQQNWAFSLSAPVAVVKQNGFNPNGFILVSKMYGDMPKVFLEWFFFCAPEIILAKDKSIKTRYFLVV